jgi:DnaJ-class molecular chaperone
VLEQCPACNGEGGAVDGQETLHCCCGIGPRCGDSDCNGPEVRYQEWWVPCELCKGTKFVDRVIAVTYVLEA